MARQTGSIKAVGTVNNVSFYQQEGAYLARRKTGVDKKRFLTESAFKGSRASSSRFGNANTLWSLVYRYVLPSFKGRKLCDICRSKGIALAHQHLTEAEVLWGIYNYLQQLHCLTISPEDFEQTLPILLREAAARAEDASTKDHKPKEDQVTFIISEPPTEADKELFIHYTDDFKWSVVFTGTFPSDYEIPICFLGHLRDEFRGMQATLMKPGEKIRSEWVRME